MCILRITTIYKIFRSGSSIEEFFLKTVFKIKSCSKWSSEMERLLGLFKIPASENSLSTGADEVIAVLYFRKIS